MTDKQFLMFMKMLKAQYLLIRSEITDEPFMPYFPEMGATLASSDVPEQVQRADDLCGEVLQWAEDTNQGSSG
jgi:hypothetical protein